MESDQVFAIPGKDLRLLVADDHQILDPDPAEAGEVDAGLDGDDVADRDRAAGLLREPRVLVDEQADTVAEAVPERLAEAGRVDAVACRRVHPRPGRTRPNSLEPRDLGIETDLVGAHEL